MTTYDKKPSISCVIPMYNEEENAEKIIGTAEKILSQTAPDWEIIIIESGSSDNTRLRVGQFIKGKEKIRAYYQDKKKGMGSALRLGYSKCKKELVCHLEADSPFEMQYFKKALPILSENDCVIGYRVGQKKENFKWSYYNLNKKGALLRTVYHVGYNVFLRLAFGLVIRDANFSFKIFKRKHIEKMDLISNGWFIDAELLLELRRMGILPVEMPIEYKDRVIGRSTVSIFSPFRIVLEMVRYIGHTRKKQIGN